MAATASRRLVGYVRVGPRERVGDPPTLAAQRRQIASAAEARGWSLTGFRQDTRSGRTLRRPGLDLALRDCREGRADGIVVSQLDRLTYSLADLATLVGEAAAAGHSLVAIAEDLDLDRPDGAVVGRVLAQAAGWTPAPLERAARAPALVGRRGRPTSTPEHIAERIRDMRAAGATLQAICDVLNQEGVATPRGGTRWRPTSLRSILRP